MLNRAVQPPLGIRDVADARDRERVPDAWRDSSNHHGRVGDEFQYLPMDVGAEGAGSRNLTVGTVRIRPLADPRMVRFQAVKAQADGWVGWFSARPL